MGPGSRIPTVIVSPYAKKGVVDHTVYDTTSIMATIEHKFGLEPVDARGSVTPRDALVADLANAVAAGRR